MFTAKTDNKIRREEHLKGTEEFNVIFNELTDTYEIPEVIGKEDNLYSLYYSKKPSTFTEDAEIYALKVDNTTGQATRKQYFRGNTSGIVVDYEVIGTGEFLDKENTYTLYHGDGVSFKDATTMSKPYKGTTYTNNEIIRTTDYNWVLTI